MTFPYGSLDVDQVPLPPVTAERLTTACNYCIVACGYVVWRWPVGQRDGGPAGRAGGVGARAGGRLSLRRADQRLGQPDPAQHRRVRGAAAPCRRRAGFRGRCGEPVGQPLDPRRHAGAETLQPQHPDPRPAARADGPHRRHADPGQLGSGDRRDGRSFEIRAGEIRRPRLGDGDLELRVLREHLRDLQAGRKHDRHAGLRPPTTSRSGPRTRRGWTMPASTRSRHPTRIGAPAMSPSARASTPTRPRRCCSPRG